MPIVIQVTSKQGKKKRKNLHHLPYVHSLSIFECQLSNRIVHRDTQLNLNISFVLNLWNSFSSSLSDLRGKTDGKMDNVHALRDQYGADVVAMIIEDPQYCGLGYVGPSESSMFSVTKYSCATGYYTFGHEIG